MIRERIRATARFLARKQREVSPRAISDAVMKKLSDDDLRDALDAALPYLVRDEIRKYRFTGIGEPPPRGRETWEGHAASRTVTAQHDRIAKSQAFKAVKAGNPVHDSAMLDTPFHVDGEWKTLGDFSVDDCRAMARGLRESAAAYEDRADGWEKLARAMKKAGAATVREYDATGDVREAFGAVVA